MSRHLGAQAENQAAAHLERLGYRIIARNVTLRGGELDLVAIDKVGGDTLCFVEVRARGRDDWGSGEETVGAVKRRRLIFAAEQYLARWRGNPDIPCRFDVVAIGPDGVRVFKNAFDAGTA